MFHPSSLCAAALLAASLGGCQSIGGALGGGGGVMTDGQIAPPPDARASLRSYQGRQQAPARADVAAAAPARVARPLAVPGQTGGSRTAEAGSRRINREDIEGNAPSGGGGSGGLSPGLTPGGGMGMGGRF